MDKIDDELRLALTSSGMMSSFHFAESSRQIFLSVMKTYPYSGSKIDWSGVPGAIEEYEPNPDLHSFRFSTFFDGMCLRFGLSGSVTYVGDSATDGAIEGSVDAFQKILAVIFDIPQHHYFVGPNLAWCMCMTMEGDMAFGHATTKIRIS